MWTFDGENWNQDDAATPARDSSREREITWEERWVPRLQEIEITKEDPEVRFPAILPWLSD